MAKNKFYAVKAGKVPGIYETWDEAQAQVSGFSGAEHKSFKTREEALAYMGDGWEPAAASASKEEEKPVSLPIGTPAYAQSADLEAFLSRYYPDRQFTPDQKEAIRSIEGRHLLFAIPGSGKTAVLTARAGYMIYAGRQPENMLIMTFGKNAAEHMKEVFRERFPEWQCPNFCTIHSFCNSVLKKLQEMTGEVRPRLVNEGEDDPIAEADEILLETEWDEKKGSRYAGRRSPVSILSGILAELGYFKKKADARLTAEFAAPIITCIKNRMMTDAEIRALGRIDIGGTAVDISELYRAYVSDLRDHRPEEMDFDDMLRRAYDAFVQYPELLEHYRRQYRYISVDEAQDTSHLQHEIIRALAGDTGNLFMVGDDDQSIYAFRGADPEEMLAFQKNYRDGVIHRMGVNFRSDRLIVNAADKLIQNNRARAEKDMLADSGEAGSIRFLDMTHEAQVRYILDRAMAVRRENAERRAAWEALPAEEQARRPFRPRTLAILYRNNSSALVPLAYFFRYDIPFTGSGIFDILSMFDRRAAISLLRLLEFTQRPGDFSAYKRAWYVLNNYRNLFLRRELAVDAVRELYAGHEGEPVLPFLSRAAEEAGMYEKADSVFEAGKVLEDIREKDSPYDGLKRITTVLEFSKNNCMQSSGAQMLAQALMEIASLYGSIRAYLDAIQRMHEKKDWDERREEGMEEIVLSTMHSAKGQEYDEVILYDVTDDVIPGNAPNRELPFWYRGWTEQIEEERRLFYVACTRARHHLEILTDGFNAQAPNAPSRFVKELHECLNRPPVENAGEHFSQDAGGDSDGDLRQERSWRAPRMKTGGFTFDVGGGKKK